MYLSYNGYAHAENEVWFHISRSVAFTPRNRREKEIQRWDIMGVVIGDSESDLTGKMQALENAYSVNGGDLLFYGNAGALTRHTLYSANTINGTRVVKFDWLAGNPRIWGAATEYVNLRTYRIVVAAETLWADDNIYSYNATLSAVGTCGPRKLWMPSLTGVPQQQIVQAYTTQKIVQSGRVVGLVSPEPADPPLFPVSVEHLDRRMVETGAPLEVGVNVSLKHPTRWAYFFESPSPLM